MIRKILVSAIALGLGASSSPALAAPFTFNGSDTLFELTKDVILHCNAGGGALQNDMTYLGGGSSLGGTQMIADAQQIAPQSRFMSKAECNEEAVDRGQGMRLGLDGVGIFHDTTVNTGCDVLRYAGCMEVPGFGSPGYQCPNCVDTAADTDTDADEYCFTHWADVLRIVYNGQHAHINDSSQAAACDSNDPTRSAIADKRCASNVRKTLVNTWTNLFDSAGDDGAGQNCPSGECTRLKHAYRRDDFSGTTDAFLTLIGAPSLGTSFNVRTFCNGLENEDLDPVRRACGQTFVAADGTLDTDSVCGWIPFKYRNAPIDANGNPTGASTNNLPLAFDSTKVPTAATPEEDVQDLGLVIPVSIPTTVATQYDDVGQGTGWCANFASGGQFFLSPMPGALSAATKLCPDGSPRVAEQCYWPRVSGTGATARKWNCMARRTNRFNNGPAPFKGYDARYYNMIPRNPDTGAILQPNNNAILDPRWSTAGAYRIHQKRPAVANASRGACKATNSTDQIGCLVKADPCSIGYAGLEARDSVADANGTNAPLSLRAPYDPATGEVDVVGAEFDIEVFPGESTVQYLLQPSSPSSGTCAAAATRADRLFGERYPLSRVLWLSSSNGFGSPRFTGVTGTGAGSTRERDLTECYEDLSGTLGRISAVSGDGVTSVNQLLEKHGFFTLGKSCTSNANCTAPSTCVGGACTLATDDRVRTCSFGP